MSTKLVAVIVGALVVIGHSAQAGGDPVDECISAKEKAAGMKALGLLRAFARNVKKPNDEKLVQDISKVHSKFTKGFSKADTLGPCTFLGDAAEIEPAVDDCVSEVIDLINFGTITTTTTTVAPTTTSLPQTTTTVAPTTSTVPPTSTTATTPTSTTTTLPLSITQIIDWTGDGAGNPLDMPTDIAVDTGGNVYVSGIGSDNAFKITPLGVITEIINWWGDGAGNQLDCPQYIDVDVSGNVYVSATCSNNAFKITPLGVITEIIDSTGDGAGNPLDAPEGIAVDGLGNVYVTGYTSDNAFKIPVP